MMLMLSKTGLGSWAHMNLHESKSPEERREDSGIAALPGGGGGAAGMNRLLHLCLWHLFRKQGKAL